MKMKKNWGLISLCLGMILLGIFTIQSIVKIQSYGQLINYVGIVRGGTQRLVKLELQGEPADSLITYLDDILANLNTGHGKYNLIRLNDATYQNDLSTLTSAWVELREEILAIRSDPDMAKVLLEDSETYFNIANETVFSAQYYSQSQTTKLMVMIIGLLLCLLLAWVIIFRKDAHRIVNLEKSNQDLTEKTGRDMLTGAYSIAHFKQSAREILAGDKTHKYVILYADFEEFKYINDVFGYDYGDSILRKYAQIIQDDLSAGELVARVNADNFVILRKYADKSDILPRQRSIDEKINQFARNSDAGCSLSVCCGICCLEDLSEMIPIEGILDRANFGRKTVKQGRHKNYAFYDDSIRQTLLAENAIRSELEYAFTQHQFLVYYQPKILLSDGSIAGSEALVRWKKPDGTIISPDVFIPILEKDKNIAILDHFVMEEVCKWTGARIREGKTALPISVNVSRNQFYNPDFVDKYIQIRDSYGIPHELLEIEFTETIAFENTQLMVEIATALNAAGFSCSIDDFGKGYSSLGLLKELPVTTLKMDKDFFNDLESDEKEKRLVEGIVDIMKKLDVTVVAEGIETSSQVDFLKSIHCDMVQGYFFHKPMPQEEYGKLLDQA